ncbi:uncharacterized protein PHACADRAFT_198415 [Phanerochaete carnosa HHB-10118-sp]|uniref:Major facilitator superfamily (MFS) profile domain-containing protein n=1 Tax=Phanerochaete carnosa (strain HHB-10118-sp) TaxID=650164 RepID=K5W0G7_PHACS|nr:uncharacterized protein PHACADRAFT_198415 [Phanerochaete carnosa HHB-10118-sp]EKM52354.1 hypothetical protein PHACADRAFT_198415 [Phanerochaete carnosa HHB-10118-sp]
MSGDGRVKLTSTGPTSARRGIRFWLIILAVCMFVFLSALEFSAVATALPTITHDLNGGKFVWIASAYGLASTVFLPASGGMADIWSCKPFMLLWLGMFGLESTLCSEAQNMNWLIAARIQGVGGGGILSVSSIIILDLVPLRERATYNGLIGMTWGVAAAIGPIIGGALAQHSAWRWLFYLNLPITGVATLLIAAFLRVWTPGGLFSEKLSRMDWIGNVLIIGSSSLIVISLTWGRVKFSWSSA